MQMGGMAAMKSIERVMEAHHDELCRETWEALPDVIKALRPKLELEAQVDFIERWLAFTTPEHGEEHLQLPDITIWELEERFPDCNISW